MNISRLQYIASISNDNLPITQQAMNEYLDGGDFVKGLYNADTCKTYYNLMNTLIQKGALIASLMRARSNPSYQLGGYDPISNRSYSD